MVLSGPRTKKKHLRILSEGGHGNTEIHRTVYRLEGLIQRLIQKVQIFPKELPV